MVNNKHLQSNDCVSPQAYSQGINKFLDVLRSLIAIAQSSSIYVFPLCRVPNTSRNKYSFRRAQYHYRDKEDATTHNFSTSIAPFYLFFSRALFGFVRCDGKWRQTVSQLVNYRRINTSANVGRVFLLLHSNSF